MMKAKSTGKRKKERAIGADFVAPDGGWGWFVVLAAGCSNLSTFPVLQQFGLLFRDRLTSLGLSGKEITTIINLNSCVTSCLGLLNGPMFRLCSYRKVAFFGAVLSAIGVLCTSVANSFGTYVLTFSVLYGAGTGINSSASALALNTYFHQKRRIATGISWTATALGPIVFPHVIAVFIPMFGVQGTVLLFGGLALNAVALALVYQPVEWHTLPAPKRADENGEEEELRPLKEDATTAAITIDEQYPLCGYCARKNRDDAAVPPSYDIVETGTPMLSSANDGWFSQTPAKRSLYSSRISLASTTAGFGSSRMPSYANVQLARSPPDAEAAAAVTTTTTTAPPPLELRSNRASSANLAKEAKRDKLKQRTNELKIEETEAEDCPSYKAPQDLQDKEGKDPAATVPPPKPMFIINDSFKRKLSVSTRPDATAASKTPQNTSAPNTADVIDDQLLASSGWLTAKTSALPTRNDSVLSFFDMTPRRNFSTASFHAEKEVLRSVRKRLQKYVDKEEENGAIMTVGSTTAMCCTCGRAADGDRKRDDDNDEEVEETYSWWQRVFIFFDLDLLRDWSYVNLMVGVTIASFAELNYSILTPFVLGEYGLTKPQTASSMSLLGAMDISVRFFVPFIAGRIGWENKTFFLVGVLGMALGRISIAHFHSYPAVLAASVWIGLNKGLRTVFMALVIPSYVPLERLPGATGLQLLFAGIFYFVMGPVIGWIRDTTNYTVTLHCLNIATFTTAICWTLEKLYHKRKAAQQAAAAKTQINNDTDDDC